MKILDELELENDKYILVKGDISGIQEFIFNVKSKKAAQSLKGRSFFIKVLTEISIQFLFDLFRIGDDIKNSDFRISTSGGNFFLKLPYIQDTESKIKNAQLLLSKGLRFSGINVSLNYVPLNEIKYSDCLIELNKKTRENKLSLFAGLSNDDFSDLFSPNNKSDFTLIDKNENWMKITAKINSCKYFSIGKYGNTDLTLKSDSIELIGYKCLFHNLETEIKKIFLSDYLESLSPIKDGNIKEFEDLVKVYGCGAEKLGILKMDVDNLGTTLEQITNLNNHKEFDMELNNFFNIELRKIINNPEENFRKNIYTVTAGGDDSFFVGNWKIILKLAEKIHNSFTNYLYFKEKGLTISAGYIIVNPKFPVVRFTQIAEDAIHKAKYKYSKGNICILDEVLSWDMLNKVNQFKSILKDGVNKKSKALLANSRQTAIRGIDEEVIILKDNWEMSYFLRNCKDEFIVNKIRNAIKNNINESIKISDLSNEAKLKKRSLRLILPVAARIVELEMR